MRSTRFVDRADAGRRLAAKLSRDSWDEAIVLGLPRGGVPVAREVADILGLPLDVLVVRKLGYPGHPELAIGAIGEGGVHVANERLLAHYPVPAGSLETIERSERRELDRRVATYRGDRPGPDLSGKTVIVVDDGMATGSSMLAAVEVLRCQGAGRVVVAVPVSSPSAVAALAHRADEVVSLLAPRDLGAVGVYYEDFAQVDDRTVTRVLAGASSA